MTDSRIQEFWKRNRTLIIFGLIIFFILSVVVEVILGIVFLYRGEIIDYVYALAFFGSAFVSGCFAFALVRIRKKTS